MKTKLFFAALLDRVKRFLASERGMTLPLTALSMVAMVGFTGIAIDVGRMQMVQSKLQFSLDAAGLAAGSTASTADVTTEVTKYLNVNFNGYMGAVINGAPVITINNTTTTINLSATASLPTTFMQVLGISTINVTANSTVSRQITGLEVSVVIDVSYGDDLTDFKAGLSNFIQTLFKSAAGVSGNLYVSIVPFNHTVNIGTNNSAWLNPSYNPGPWAPTSWGGCVMARSGAEATSDDPPTTGSTLFNEYYYPSDTAATIQQKLSNVGPGITAAQASADFTNYAQWPTLNARQQTDSMSSEAFGNDYGLNIWQGVVNGAQRYASPLNSVNQGPNFMCPPAIAPLTNNEATVLNTINSISVIQGDWLPDLGVEWGWNTLSPRWQGLWGTGGLPKNYNTPGWNKAIVWVEGYTTGSGYVFQQGNYIDNNIYGGYQYLQNGVLGTTNMTTAINTINSRALQVCNQVKADNVYVYLLGYSANGSASGLPSFMASCATGQNYAFWFGPGDWAAFNTALNSIADSLVNLWLSH